MHTAVMDGITGNNPLRVWVEGQNFTDNSNNLMVMGREYGGGGTNALARALHVDPDGAVLPVAARLQRSATAAVGAAVTLTMPTPNAGYWMHITSINITKFNAALLTAGATPVLVGTTGLSVATNTAPNAGISAATAPTQLSWAFSAAASAAGTIEEKILMFDQPLRAAAAAGVITIVAPAITNVIWQINVTGYVA